eukprot:Lithocolla_globosa_v1_NODE_3_length_14236_cov_22.745998.p7 type:complete len:245 gc:universal NODE_3_length_14236_cov_22.745998:7196-6462(-)
MVDRPINYPDAFFQGFPDTSPFKVEIIVYDSAPKTSYLVDGGGAIVTSYAQAVDATIVFEFNVNARAMRLINVTYQEGQLGVFTYALPVYPLTTVPRPSYFRNLASSQLTSINAVYFTSPDACADYLSGSLNGEYLAVTPLVYNGVATQRTKYTSYYTPFQRKSAGPAPTIDLYGAGWTGAWAPVDVLTNPPMAPVLNRPYEARLDYDLLHSAMRALHDIKNVSEGSVTAGITNNTSIPYYDLE